MKRSHFTLLILGNLICAVSTNVEALTRQFEYSGIITEVYDPHGVIGPGYTVPMEVYGTFVADTNYTSWDDGSIREHPIISFNISFADVSFDIGRNLSLIFYGENFEQSYIYGSGVGVPTLPQGDWEWAWAEFGLGLDGVTLDDMSTFSDGGCWYFIVENYDEGAPDGFNFLGKIDTITEIVDACPTDPNKTEPGICGCGIPDTDTDLDGTPDCTDGCPNDINKTQPGICGCGIADTDSDGDGIPDCNDDCDNSIDSDGDGLNDCNDLCPNDPNKKVPGTCGCGVADTDSDGDGILDCKDVNDDGDGLPDGEEQGPDRNNPNYDGNGDGLADHLQGNVASFHTYNNENYITIASPPGTTIRNCKAVNNPSDSNSPQNIDFPHGFFGFTIEGLSPGDAATATMYLPEGESFNTYYKYGPTPDNPINHWYEFLYDGQTGANINGNVITLNFVDGLRGDDDLIGQRYYLRHWGSRCCGFR